VRFVVLALILISCGTVAPLSRPPNDPEPAPPHAIWAYERTLLPAADQTTYENVLLDAKPLSDGGWVVLRAVDPRRYLVDPTSYGPLIKQPYGELLKLDTSGRIVAKEHAAEPLGLTKVDVFEEQGVIVAQGRQVRNGTVHALRLDTLDGIASELTNCIAIEGRCWSFRTARYQGSTALEERDPRTLGVTRTYPHLTMDGLYGQAAIFPSVNFIAWGKPAWNTPNPQHGVRVEPLDPTRPIAIPWLDQLRGACDVTRVGDDRALVAYGPPDCEYVEGSVFNSDLVEVSTGKLLRRIHSDEGISGNELAAGRLVLAPVPYVIDPRTGNVGPLLQDRPVSVDFDRGLAVIPLSGGGSAVLRRRSEAARSAAVGYSAVAGGRCRDVDFPHVVLGPADFACQGMTAHIEAGQLLIATGRNYRSPVDFEVSRVILDPATKQVEIAYAAASLASRPLESGPVRIISLPDVPTGEWLVRVAGAGGSASGPNSTFVVRFR
jgi:hypothetical protein